MTFLDQILQSKRESKANQQSEAELSRLCDQNNRNDIRKIKASNSLDVIAEIKRRSPSKGELAEILHPEVLATTYENAGACVISVLTDNEYFGGTKQDFEIVRKTVSVPVLRKDFAIDVADVYETYLMGADVLLLIVAAFEDKALLKTMHDVAQSLGMSVLVETHSQEEIEIAQSIGAKIVGVNVRDLSTFEETPDLGKKLLSSIDETVLKVWESSIMSVENAQVARESGADVVLVGQGLVQSKNPGDFIEQMRNIS